MAGRLADPKATHHDDEPTGFITTETTEATASEGGAS
jgi:hypothetical protein